MYYAGPERKPVMLMEDNYHGHFELANIGIVHIDRYMRVQVVNEEAEELCGVSRANVRGKRAEYAFAHLGDKFMQALCAPSFDDIALSTVRAKIGDQLVYLQIATIKIRDENNTYIGMVVLMQDSSSMRAAMKQIQTTQMLMALGELAAGVAHHVRTPLTTVSGYLQVMLGRLNDDQYAVKRDVLETMLDEVSHINNVVTELVMFAKPNVCKDPGVNVNRIVEEALLLTFKEIGDDIYIEKALTEGIPTIDGDSNLLKQSFVNILQNAVESMGEQGTLSIRSWLHSDLKMVVVSIADTGNGISLDLLSRVFEPFYTTKLDRMGLGLPTAHRIISEHGGLINLRSNGGRSSHQVSTGTQVLVYLPIVSNDPKRLPVFYQQILNLQ